MQNALLIPFRRFVMRNLTDVPKPITLAQIIFSPMFFLAFGYGNVMDTEKIVSTMS